MPKVIPDVRKRIITAARNQIKETGYDGLSIRNIAKECGIAVGTTYNYFPSKMELADAILKDEWDFAINHLDDYEANDKEILDVFAEIFDTFYELFCEYEKSVKLIHGDNNLGIIYIHHKLIISDLAVKLGNLIYRYGYVVSPSYTNLIAEITYFSTTQTLINKSDYLDIINKILSDKK